MVYSVMVGGKKLVYGANVIRSRFSEVEIEAIANKIVEENTPETFLKYKDDKQVIKWIAYGIDMAERYELLLELLPQSAYSKAGTHPSWVADAIYDNVLDKVDTQEDVKTFINICETIEDLIKELKDYFELKEDFEG